MSFRVGGRDLPLVVGAKAVSLLGDEVATLALVLRLQSQGAGAAAVAGLLMANLVPIVALSGVVGRLVDRRDNRRLLAASSAAQVGACVALAAVSNRAAVFALVAALGIGQAVNGATWQALLPSLVPAGRLPHALASAQAATTVAGLAAPALGGLLSGLYGTRVPLLLDAATFAVVTLAAVLIRHRRVLDVRAGERLRGGLAIAAGNPLLRAVLILLAASVLLGSLVNVVEVFLVRDTLGAGAVWYGLAGAAYMTGLLGGALVAGRLGTAAAHGRWFVAATAALSAGLVLMGLAPDVGWLLACAVATGSANGVLNVCMSTLVMGSAAPGERGRLGALLGGVASGTQLAAYAASGALAAVLSPRAIFVAAGLAGLLAPALFGRAVVRASAAAPRAAAPSPASSAAPTSPAAPTSSAA